MYSSTLVLALPAALLAATAIAQSNASVFLPSKKPVFSTKLSPNLAAFSIEMDRWTYWAGDAVGSPNEYVVQLLDNLAERTGAPPSFRVGADSEDHGFVDLSVAVVNATFPPATEYVPFPEATHISIGRDFYALSANFPKGTKFTWGINLKSENITETVRQAALLADTFQGTRKAELANVTLELVEIGNEADFYPFPGWWPVAYVDLWTQFATAVMDVLKFGSSKGPKLQAGGFGDFALVPFIDDLSTWNAVFTLNAGILDGPPGPHVGTFADHNYAGAYNYTPLAYSGELMNKDNIRANLSHYVQQVNAVNAVGLTFVLGETNSYANHGDPGTSNTAEAAIWAVDHLLQAASIGIERLHFHHGVGYRYNLFQPVAGADDGLNLTSRPHILPAYHGFLIVNEAIGSSGNSYVAELGTNSVQIAAYGIWEGDSLARAVLINSALYIPTNSSTVRPAFAVDLLNMANGKSTTAKRLAVPFTNATSGLTWGGQNFDTVSGVPQGGVVEETVTGGVIKVAASEVVLLSFQ